ncbi:homologous recombination OB-fold protein [Lonchura striata]
MSCHFQRLFGTDGELEDEDFLSAVQDAENQFVIPGHSSPSAVPVLPSEPQTRKPHPSEPHPSEPQPSGPQTRKPHPSEPQPSGPQTRKPHPSEPHPSEPHPSEPQPSGPQTRKPHPSEPQPSGPQPSEPQTRKPHPSEPHPSEPQIREPQTSGPQPSRPQPSGPQTSEPQPSGPQPSGPQPSRPPSLRPLAQQPVGLRVPPWRGAAPQDEQDNALFLAACRELEGPGAAPLPPGRREKPPWKGAGKENAQECGVPKKLRLAQELVPGSGGLQEGQGPLPSPRPVLRPSAAGAPRPPPSLGEPRGSAGSVPAPGAPCLRPGQAPPGRSSSSVPWTPPAQSCPQPRLPPRPPSGPPSSVESPGFPNPPVAPNAPGPPSVPVVTNHLVQLVAAASKAPPGAPRAPGRRESRRFPGPAGILPQQHSGKLLEEILVAAPQAPAHGAVAKPRAQALPSSPLPTEEDFGKGPWLAMKTELGLDERDPSCFLHSYSVVMVLRKAALKQLPKNKVPSMAVMIKSLTRSSAGAGAVFRDPTGEMQGTLHRLLLEQRQSELRAGSVLLLRQVGVFSPSHRNHYLNVTPNNLLRIFPPEPEGCSPRQVPGLAELSPEPPARPTRAVPAPEHRGQPRTGGPSAEQRPGGSSLRPASSDPGWEGPVGTDGCDLDDLDGLLGELPEDFFSAPARVDCG